MLTEYEQGIANLNNEIRILKDEIKDLTMRLSAIKVIVTKIEPSCSNKLENYLKAARQKRIN